MSPFGRTEPSRYGRDTTALEVVRGVDLSGRFILVTGGGGSGMGYQISRALAHAGATVMIGARDKVRGEDAAQKIREDSGNPAVSVGLIDLGSLKSIGAFVEGFVADGQPIDVLIDHAGIAYLPQHTLTQDGFEAVFGTNYIGHFALTCGLLPALRAQGGARVVVVASNSHHGGQIPWLDPGGLHRPYDGFQAYADSKAALCLFIVGWNARYAADHVLANAISPGAVFGTGMNQHVDQADWIRHGYIFEDGTIPPWFKTAEQGAATAVWAAVAPELEGRGGLYLADCGIAGVTPHHKPGQPGGYAPHAFDPATAERLWAATQGWLSERGY
jgi:NAD(P)-dependent dehydrogenase (short-subunit alcohol dehydrogenase family)